MTASYALIAAAALALGSTPALAQAHQHPAATPAEPGQDMNASAMICTMGMLPHPGMGGGMMGGQGMGGMMKQGAMAPGAMMGGMKHDSAHAPGSMMKPASPTAPAAPMAMAGMAHPITPTMLVHHSKEIELTAEQLAQVTQLAQSSQASCEQHLSLAKASHEAANALLAGTVSDVAAYQARLREASGHVIEAHIAVVKAGVDAQALLTPAQREKLAATARMEHGK